MPSETEMAPEPAALRQSRENSTFLRGLGRALGGALIFSLPMFMTMELWRLGAVLDAYRLAALVLLTIPILVGMSHYGGFRPTQHLRDDLADALVAMLIAGVASTASLWLFGLFEADMSMREVLGRIIIQTAPASFGAVLARSQLGGRSGSEKEETAPRSYHGELFIMAVGALFIAFNIAPTEEIELIAYKMSTLQLIGLIFVSIAVMHGFIYSVNFHGGPKIGKGDTLINLFPRFTLTGYAMVLALCLVVLWLFQRTSGMSLAAALGAAVVLGFPAAVGASAARLML